MAITFNFGNGAQSATPVTRTIRPWNYTAAFRATSTTGNSARMVDTKTDLDKMTTIKTSRENIADVYATLAADSIPIANRSANSKGTTCRVELKTTASKEVEDFVILLPMECDIRIRFPNDAEITGQDIDTLINAAYACALDSLGDNLIISDLARGALTPAGV